MNHSFSRTIVLASMCLVCAITTRAVGAVNWRTNLDAAKIEAAQTDRFILLHFWKPSCGPCQQLEQAVFSHPPVGPAIEQDYVPVKINTERWPAITNAFGVTATPKEIILSPQGAVISTPPTPRTPEEYAKQLSRLAAHFRQASAAPSAAAQSATVNPAYSTLPISSIAQTNAGAAASNQRGVATTPATTQATATGPASPSAASAAAGTSADRYAAGRYRSAPSGVTPASAVAQTTPSPYQNPYMNAASTVDSDADGATAKPNGQATQATASGPASIAQQSADRQQAMLAAQPATTMTSQPTTSATTTAASSTPEAQASTATTSNPTTPTPQGAAPLGLDGYCPVTLRFAKKWVKGSPKIGIVHRGRTYLFAGEGERQQFLANPDMYSPVFNGIDPVLLIDDKTAVEGTRRYGFEYRGAVYLFSSKETMEKFGANPDVYAAGVMQAMRRLDGTGGATSVR